MKKFVLIPDSFKGTLSSKEICEIAEKKIKEIFSNAKVVSIPVADGGEGSVDCFLSAVGGERVTAEVSGPYFEKMQGFYGIINDGKTAVIEMAAVAGLPLVENNKNPLKTTTYGVGELMVDAAKRGVKSIILGLGGSCTNDFGCGAAAACGVKFFDGLGKEFIPTGGTLKDISRIDLSEKNELLKNVNVIAMCDIDNPPVGVSGAAEVFAPQKGADKDMVKLLDQGVKHLCEVYKNDFGKDLSTLSGGGAAGAFGAGAVAFFDADLKMGIDTVLDTVGLDDILSDTDMVFTGEGKIDGQSLRGKVVIGVARRAKKQGVPVIAIVGGADGDMSAAYDQGVSAVFSINRLPEDFSVSRYKSRENLEFALDNLLRALKVVDNKKR
ncbi:MAG: glycerate kinase [Clostridiales bacterium]|nr:glycerate kinase [Clostridiales bacterium]